MIGKAKKIIFGKIEKLYMNLEMIEIFLSKKR